MTIQRRLFNNMPEIEAVNHLLTCCTSENWAKNLSAKRPFTTIETLLECSDAIWQQMTETDYLQAFAGHPQIGDVSTLKAKYQNTASSAAFEQSGAHNADNDTLKALADGNQAYLDKFGFIFIVFATGKTAAQMLTLLNERLPNTREQELVNGAREQNKITRLRLSKLIVD